MPAPGRSPRTCAHRDRAGYCVSATGAAEAGGPSIALKKQPSSVGHRGGPGSTTISCSLAQSSPVPASQLGELRHRGEGSPDARPPGAGAMWVGAGRWGAQQGLGGVVPPAQAARPTTATYISLWLLGRAAWAVRNGMALVWMTARPGPPRLTGRRARVTSWMRGVNAQSPADRVRHWQRPARARPSPCDPGWAQRPGWQARALGAVWSCWPGAPRPWGRDQVRRGAARAARRTVGVRRGSGDARAAPVRRGAQRESRVRRHRARSAAPGDWRVRPGGWRWARAQVRGQQTQAPGVGGAQGVASLAPGAPPAGAPPAGRSSWPQLAAAWRWRR